MNEKTTEVINLEKKPGKGKAILIFSSIIVLIGVIILVIYLNGSKPDSSASEETNPMGKLVTQIRNLETDVQQKQTELVSLSNEYKEKTGQELSSVNILNLTPDQKEIMEKIIQEEKDASTKTLLNNILQKNNDINDLKKKITEVEAKLPQPHVVAQGENHFEIALKFLVEEKGVDRKQAEKLIERSALFDLMRPGFKVWNYYDNNEYGAFVTQGTADVSPNTLRRQEKKLFKDTTDERDRLAIDIKQLELRKEELLSQIQQLGTEKTDLENQNASLNTQNKGLETSLNSVFYVLDSKKNLEKQGIIKDGFLRSPKLNNIEAEDFKNSIDLRADTKILVSAESFNLKKIKKIVIYPQHFKNNWDYKISIDKDSKNATLTILNVEKLKNERLIISVI